MKSFHYGGGAALALLCAGPLFLLGLLVGQLLCGSQPADRTGQTFAFALMLLLPATVIGLLAALLPVTFGGLLMGWLGSRSRPARHPLLWGIVGALIGLLMALGLGVAYLDGVNALFAINGAICALLVRYGTRWSDDSA